MTKPQKKEKSIKKNFLYNLAYQIFTLIIPLVVTPYVSRVLTSEGVGQYSFAYSIVFYFTLLAALGFDYYAQREVARVQDDPYKQTIVFWEIFFVKTISTIISAVAFLGMIQIPYFHDYRLLLYILSMNIIAVGLDTTYVFRGNEDFKQIALRNFISKSIIIVCIFLFVKQSSDLWIYTLLNTLNPIISALLMLPFLRRYLVKVRLGELHPQKHIGPCLRLFIPTIAVSVYTMLDRTMIGFFVNGDVTVIKDGVEVVQKLSDIENGYYEQAEKLVKMGVAAVTSLGTVMIPKNTFYYSHGEKEKLRQNILKALSFVYILGFPMMFGLIAIADVFCPVYFGPGYEKVPSLVMAFSPLILFIGLNNTLGNQYLIPCGKDKVYTTSVTIGAICNLTLNAILIPFFSSMGAVIASVTAEFVILSYQMIYLRKEFSLKDILSPGVRYFDLSLLMFILVYFVGNRFSAGLSPSLILIALGVLSYVVLLWVTKDYYFVTYTNKAKDKILHLFKKK